MPEANSFPPQPTTKDPSQVLADFQQVTNGTTSYGQLLGFLNSDFSGEGQEFISVNVTNFNDNPPFLENVSDSTLQAYSKTVHSYWNLLIRGMNASRLCEANEGCESSIIPLNNTFVVPGTLTVCLY